MEKDQIDIRHLVDKVMHDKPFYEKLKENPAAALREIGVDATPAQLESLKKLNYHSLEIVASAFGPDRFVT